MSYKKLSKGLSQKQAQNQLEKVMPTHKEVGSSFQGLTPPSIFIGSHNYPKVNTGVLSPSTPTKSSAMMDNPKKWIQDDYSIQKIANLRTSLINSKRKTKVKKTEKFTNKAQEIAMADKQVNIEVQLDKNPRQNVSGGRVKPVSSSADIKQFKLGENPSVNRQIEKKFYDNEAKTETAIKELQNKNLSNYKIQQALSAGTIGKKENRKLVPTRWSITATDTHLGNNLREDVGLRQEIGETLYFNESYLGNEFHIFIMPGKWEYELIELKRPGSTFNQSQKSFIVQNYEGFQGRKSYAEETAGAYYAARLAALEYLDSIHRQAKVLIVREVTPKYWLPLGVWTIRETVRKALQNEEQKLDGDISDIKKILSSEFTINYPQILNQSKLLKDRQTSIESFF